MFSCFPKTRRLRSSRSRTSLAAINGPRSRQVSIRTSRSNRPARRPPKVELPPELQRAQQSGLSVGLSLETPEKERRSAPGSVRQAALTRNGKAKNSKPRPSSKLRNSSRRAWRATNELLEPVWKGKATQ